MKLRLTILSTGHLGHLVVTSRTRPRWSLIDLAPSRLQKLVAQGWNRTLCWWRGNHDSILAGHIPYARCPHCGALVAGAAHAFDPGDDPGEDWCVMCDHLQDHPIHKGHAHEIQ